MPALIVLSTIVSSDRPYLTCSSRRVPWQIGLIRERLVGRGVYDGLRRVCCSRDIVKSFVSPGA